MTEGWVKLHRKVVESSLWMYPNAFLIFMWLLMRASYEKRKFPFNGSDLELLPGELISSHDSIRKGTGKKISIMQIRTALDYLKSTDRITVKSYNKFSVISICNWEEYQGDNRQDNSPITGKQQASNRQITTNKNYKNLRIEELKNNTLTEFGKVMRMEASEMDKLIAKFGQPLIQQELELADEWLSLADTPNARKYRKPGANHYLFFSGWLSKKTLRPMQFGPRKGAIGQSGLSQNMEHNLKLKAKLMKEEE